MARAGVFAALLCVLLLQAAALGCALHGGYGLGFTAQSCATAPSAPSGSTGPDDEGHLASACCSLHCAAAPPIASAPFDAIRLAFLPQPAALIGDYALSLPRSAPELAPLSARAPPAA